MTCMRALLSTFVEKHELGQLFAAVGSIQSLSGMIGSLIFNTIYPHTLSFWPGFCFSLGVMISIIPLCIVIWLHRDLKSYNKYTVFEIEEQDCTEGEADVYAINVRQANRLAGGGGVNPY